MDPFSNGLLQNIDWKFERFTNSGIHSIHWYPATYISAIPGALMPQLTLQRSCIIDPFCGSGTTGLEALRLSHDFIGFDTNPIAMLITHAKLYHPCPRNFKQELSTIISNLDILANYHSDYTPENLEELRSWYHPNTLNELSIILGLCLEIKSKDLMLCFIAVFSSILKATCSQGKHWGWVCDNVKPKTHEIQYKDAISTFINACHEYISSSNDSFERVKAVSEGISRKALRSRYKLKRGDCINSMKQLKPNSVDLIMTSPPYFGVADYVKSQRLSFLWFDDGKLDSLKLGFKFFEALRSEETGARSKRHRLKARQDYISFISEFLDKSHNILNETGKIALVVGESASREETTDSLISLALEKDFHILFHEKREIVNTRRRLMAKVKSEDIIIFGKGAQHDNL